MLFLYFIILLLIPPAISQDSERYEFEHPQMGTLFKIILYAPDEETAVAASDSAFQRIDELNGLLSDYLEESELNRLPVQTGDGRFVAVSDELFYVICKAQNLSRRTEGAFDITAGPFVGLWREMNQQDTPRLPDQTSLEKTGESVGFQHLEIDTAKREIALNVPNMRLDLGGIAKGYATDEALNVLRSFGLESALIDAGGDIRLGDAPPGKDGWQIAIPSHYTPDRQMQYLRFTLSNKAIATSGDLFQFVEIDGTRYSHIINPETGLGLTTQAMVTVIAPDGITADSYASALSVMGPEKGLQLIESTPDIAARFEYREKHTIKVSESDGIEDWY